MIRSMVKNIRKVSAVSLAVAGILSFSYAADKEVLNFGIIRACPQFILRQIIVQAILNIDLKFLANFSKRVAILRKCFSFAKTFSTKCLIL